MAVFVLRRSDNSRSSKKYLCTCGRVSKRKKLGRTVNTYRSIEVKETGREGMVSEMFAGRKLWPDVRELNAETVRFSMDARR